ncbi:hypothetical protein HDV01_002116 [Terramyces sp. JEL0728]|nr:hypothetical protein HDV01_002116 [Terramyces sp. JEL0728]
MAFKVLISLIFFNREVTGRQRIGMLKLLSIILFDYVISINNSALHIFQAFNFTNIPMIHYLLGIIRCLLVPVLFLLLHEGIRRAFVRVLFFKPVDNSKIKQKDTTQYDMKKSSSIDQLNEVRSRIRQEMDGFSPIGKTSSGSSTPRREYSSYETKSSPKRFEV